MNIPQRPFYPAAERNRDPILEVLRGLLPTTGRVLEIACGTGQHAAFFATAHPHLHWYPTDGEAETLPGAASWIADAQPDAPLLHAPVYLDVTERPWRVDGRSASDAAIDAIYCANMIHIAPPEAGYALIEGAAETLGAGGRLVLYGPFRRDGAHTAPSNAAFDLFLKEKDPRFGIRDLEDVTARAEAVGFQRTGLTAMPANNFIVAFTRR